MKRTICLITLLLMTLSALGGCTSASNDGAATPAVSDAPAASIAAASPEPTATPEPAADQEGPLELVLLDAVALYVTATAYRFTQNNEIDIDIDIANNNGNPATVWFLLTGVNGWDVRNQQQAMTVITLASAEKRSETVHFDLAEGTAQYLNIDELQQLELAVEGYVDTSDYDYVSVDHVIDVADASAGYAQDYSESFETLLQNDYLTIGFCGRDEATGAVTLYYEVTQPVEGASCKLYPIENGVYDSEKYLVLDDQDMTRQSKRLIAITPVMGGADPLSGFCVVASGNDMEPAMLTLPDAPAAQPAYSDMEVVAENDQLRVRYDPQDRRFYAENLTDDQVLLIESAGSFTLDGQDVRATSQRVFCFPQTATAFRASGRAKGDDGKERNVTITADSSALSIEWTLYAYRNGQSDPRKAGAVTTGEITLPKA